MWVGHTLALLPVLPTRPALLTVSELGLLSAPWHGALWTRRLLILEFIDSPVTMLTCLRPRASDHKSGGVTHSRCCRLCWGRGLGSCSVCPLGKLGLLEAREAAPGLGASPSAWAAGGASVVLMAELWPARGRTAAPSLLSQAAVSCLLPVLLFTLESLTRSELICFHCQLSPFWF